MKINILEDGSLKILLNKNDMKNHNLTAVDIDNNSTSAKLVIEKYIEMAKLKKGFKPSKCITIETLSLDDGCLVTVTPSSDKFARNHLICSPKIFSFNNVDTLYTVTQIICDKIPLWSSCLYNEHKNYILLLYPKQALSKHNEKLLCEFGVFLGSGAKKASYFEEHSKAISIGNAVENFQ